MAEEPRQRKSLSQHTPSEQAVPVPEPEPAHTRRSDADSDSDDEREATELRDVSPGHRWHSRALTPPSAELHWYDPVKKFWRHHVRITVPHDDCRDHLGKPCATLVLSCGNIFILAPSPNLELTLVSQ